MDNAGEVERLSKNLIRIEQSFIAELERQRKEIDILKMRVDRMREGLDEHIWGRDD